MLLRIVIAMISKIRKQRTLEMNFKIFLVRDYEVAKNLFGTNISVTDLKSLKNEVAVFIISIDVKIFLEGRFYA